MMAPLMARSAMRWRTFGSFSLRWPRVVVISQSSAWSPRMLPALPLLAEQVGDRDLHVGHEDLVELGAAIDLLDGHDLDPGAAHVHQQQGQAAPLRVVRGEQENEGPDGE